MQACQLEKNDAQCDLQIDMLQGDNTSWYMLCYLQYVSHFKGTIKNNAYGYELFARNNL